MKTRDKPIILESTVPGLSSGPCFFAFKGLIREISPRQLDAHHRGFGLWGSFAFPCFEHRQGLESARHGAVDEP
jgi:hypothetical protein